MKILSDKLVIFPFGLTIALLIILFSISSAGFGEHSGELIVNYSEDGAPVVGDSKIDAILWILASIASINLILAYKLYNRQRLFSYLFSFANPILAGIILLAMNFIKTFN